MNVHGSDRMEWPVGKSLTRDFPRTLFHLVLFVSVCVSLIYTFRLYRFGTFSMDDFNNLFWSQQSRGDALIWHIINPASDFFRPVGLLVYWMHWQLFDINPLPYHLSAWLLHALNVVWVYIILKNLLGSSVSASVGCMLFVFQSSFADIYWNFGTIFELLLVFLFFLGFWIYLNHGHSIYGILLATVVYILAIKAKEMAITLPVVWLWYDIILRRIQSPIARLSPKNSLWQWWYRGKWSLMPAMVAMWFVYLKVSSMALTSADYGPSFPYYMDFSPGTIVKGYAWYLDALFHTQLGWMVWVGIVVVAVGTLAVLRHRLGLFFLGYIFISFLPVIPLPNHRMLFYWYLPFFGICGFAAVITEGIVKLVRTVLQTRQAMVLGALLFVLVIQRHYALQQKLSKDPRAWATEVAREYQSFVEGLRTLPAPLLNETIYYKSVPRYFDEVPTLSATQVAFRRTDLKARIVKEFPPDASYCVRFENGKVSKEDLL